MRETKSIFYNVKTPGRLTTLQDRPTCKSKLGNINWIHGKRRRKGKFKVRWARELRVAMKGVGINMIKICEVLKELKILFYPSIDNYLKISKIQYPPCLFVQ